MNVDTGQFEAITELADRQAGELNALREVASMFYGAGYADAGGPASARTAYRLGFAAGLRRQGVTNEVEEEVLVTTKPPHARRHLRAVQ